MMRKKEEAGDRKWWIMIVDDHPIFRQGMTQLINREEDLQVCAEAETAQQALETVQRIQPDLAIVDITLKGTNGIELLKSLRVMAPKLPVLVLSMHDEGLYAERALRAGARGYVMKQEPPEQVILAIRHVIAGELHLSSAMSNQMIHKLIEGGPHEKNRSPIDRLSDRELEVLQLIGRGRGTRQIAEELHLSVKTIESHRAHIKEKLNLSTAPEMVRFAVQWVSRE
jgi:DNA-binding NarL/FixJ family response regulator